MKTIVRFSLAAIILAAVSSCSKDKVEKLNPVQVLTPGLHYDTLIVNKVKRPFLYYIPESLPDSCWLVFYFHGSMQHHSASNPNKVNDVLTSALATQFYLNADRLKSYVFVYPKGEDLVAENVVNWQNSINVSFFDELYRYFTTRYPKISRRRVYCTGHSSGAIFSLRLAYMRPAQVAAVVSVSGNFSMKGIPVSDNKNPAAVMQVNGKLDETVQYESALDNARRFATNINGGAEEQMQRSVAFGSSDATGKSFYSADRYIWQRAKNDFVFWGVNDAGHDISWQAIFEDICTFLGTHPHK